MRHKLLPAEGGLTFGLRWNAMSFEDIGNRLLTDEVPELEEFTGYFAVAPVIFFCQAYYQCFSSRICARTTT